MRNMWNIIGFQGGSSLAISVIIHSVGLSALAFYKFSVDSITPQVAVETILADEERAHQEFSQDLSLDTRASTSLTTQAGGVVSDAIGVGGGAGFAGGGLVGNGQAKIGTSEVMKGPALSVATIGNLSIPGTGEMGLDFGEGVVKGATGARVHGYGTAMGRLSQELFRMMRKDPVTVVWLFDASISLRDDRKEISENFNKIYEELKLAQAEAQAANIKYSPLESMICSYGDNLKKLLPSPTSDIAAIQKAIASVTDDESGKENTFQAIIKTLDEFGQKGPRDRRKLAIIVVTDESGDDDELVEDAVAKAVKARAPVYFMGREAIFGYPTANVRWKDPETGLTFWPSVRRGPETEFPECLQYDGLGGRRDNSSSGFGPYAQVRLAKESGGIYFLLSGEEKELSGSEARSNRKFEDLPMKEYEPQLLARREYEAERNQSEFRKTIWQVIVAINPNLDQELRLQRENFSMEPAAFSRQKQANFSRCLRSLSKLNEGIRLLEKIEPLRDAENQPRWRAAYDLLYAQLLCFRVRQFQYLLALNHHEREKPLPKNPKSNEWELRHTQKLLSPTPDEVRVSKVDMEELEAQKKKAIEMYNRVIAEHPNTPWARRAAYDKSQGFSFRLVDRFWDPRYTDGSVKVNVPKF